MLQAVENGVHFWRQQSYPAIILFYLKDYRFNNTDNFIFFSKLTQAFLIFLIHGCSLSFHTYSLQQLNESKVCLHTTKAQRKALQVLIHSSEGGVIPILVWSNSRNMYRSAWNTKSYYFLLQNRTTYIISLK